jgi:hypothetical protein
MRRFFAFAPFLSADPFRLIAVAFLIAAMGAANYGEIGAVILLMVSVGMERISLWRKLRRGPGGEPSVKAAFAFSLIMVLSRMTLLTVLSGNLVAPTLAVVVAPLLLLITPLPLAGLYLQHRRMGEMLFPASDKFLAPQFRALLLPSALASPLAEWACGGSVMALAFGIDPRAVGLTVAAVAIFSVVSTVRFFRSRKVNLARNAYVEEIAAKIKASSPEVVFYHSGPPDSLYQYRMWREVLDKLTLKTLVVFRETGYLPAVAPAQHDTVFVRRVNHLYQIIPDSVKIILYAANGASNINMLRWHLPSEHVFINHGESDKAVNSNYFLTVYSHLFVSGQQAIDRFQRCAFTIPHERFVIVGRPQIDVLGSTPFTSGPRQTLLYAPTWEGWNPAENYSSLETMGVPLIEYLIDHLPDVQIVFKAHPFCGKNRAGVAAAVKRISELLASNGDHRIVPCGQDIMPHLANANFLITDVSSVANDFLATGRPLIITDPLALGAEEFMRRFPTGKAAYLLGTDLANIASVFQDVMEDDPLSGSRREAFNYSLGGFRGNATEQFDQALLHLRDDVQTRREHH